MPKKKKRNAPQRLTRAKKQKSPGGRLCSLLSCLFSGLFGPVSATAAYLHVFSRKARVRCNIDTGVWGGSATTLLQLTTIVHKVGYTRTEPGVSKYATIPKLFLHCSYYCCCRCLYIMYAYTHCLFIFFLLLRRHENVCGPFFL